MMLIELLILRLLHVVGGTLWVGAGIFNALLLAPAIMSAGPAAGPVMAGLRKRGLFVFLPTVAIVTILSGVRLMWITSAGFSGAYFGTARGVTYALAGAAAIVAFVAGILVAKPSGQRIGVLMAELAKTADESTRSTLTEQLSEVQRRSARINGVLTGLLALSAAGMAVARYLG